MLDRFGKAELRGGLVYTMSPTRDHHGIAVYRVARRFDDGLGGSALLVAVDTSVVLGSADVLDPDVVIFKGPSANAFVPGEAVALLVEVAGSTLRDDLGRKARLYAAARIPEYWVVDIDGLRLFRHSDPTPDGYATRPDFALGEVVAMATRPDIRIATADLF